MAKYLDNFIHAAQYGHITSKEGDLGLTQRMIDMSLMSPEAFAKKHQGNLRSYVGIVVPNAVGMGQQF